MKRTIRDRAKELAAKVMSIKFVIFSVGTVMLVLDKIDSWVWLTLAAAVAGIRYLEKKLPEKGA